MHFQEDQFYINQTLLGDQNAFGKLIQKHEKYAYTLALRIVKNPEEAEEIAQDSFMKAFHRLKSFEGKSKFTTWLYKIVYHESLGRLRKSKKFYISLDQIQEKEEHHVEFIDGVNSLLENERKELIQHAMNTLKPAESALLTLFYLDEQSIKEIEQITNLSEGNIKIILHRGRKNMMDSLKKISNVELTNYL
jgi:RNA polymerase sigma-70 factor (ECF subfamily)